MGFQKLVGNSPTSAAIPGADPARPASALTNSKPRRSKLFQKARWVQGCSACSRRECARHDRRGDGRPEHRHQELNARGVGLESDLARCPGDHA
eukprot:5163551-Alexandrium_andersonii.AAC.1